MYDWSAPRAMPSTGVETLNGKICHNGRWKMCEVLIAMPGVGRPSHSAVSSVNASGTNAFVTRTSLEADPFNPAAYQTSTTSQFDLGIMVHSRLTGGALSFSKMGVPRTAQSHKLLPLEKDQSPSTRYPPSTGRPRPVVGEKDEATNASWFSPQID